MSRSATAAEDAALVTRHERDIAPEAGNKQGENGKRRPLLAVFVVVREITFARMLKLAIRIRHAVVDQTVCAFGARHFFDAVVHGIGAVSAPAAGVAVLRVDLAAMPAFARDQRSLLLVLVQLVFIFLHRQRRLVSDGHPYSADGHCCRGVRLAHTVFRVLDASGIAVVMRRRRRCGGFVEHNVAVVLFQLSIYEAHLGFTADRRRIILM